MVSSRSSPFLHHRLTLFVIGVRICIIFELLPLELLDWFRQTPSLQALLLRFDFTSPSFDPDDEVLQFFNPDKDRMPLIQLLVRSLPSKRWLSVLLLAVDLVTAFHLEEIGSILEDQEKQSDETAITFREMDERIRPTNAHVFGFGSHQHQQTQPGENDDPKPPAAPALPPLLQRSDLPLLAAQIYFCNPISVLSSNWFLSVGGFVYFAVTTAVVLTICPRQDEFNLARIMLAATSLATATYMEPYMLTLVTSTSCALESIRERSIFLMTFTFSLLLLHGLSSLVVGPSYWREQIFSTELPPYFYPNIGVIWYFTMQTFVRFRAFFAYMFSGMRWVLPLPLTVRLHNDPLAMTTILLYAGIVLHPHPLVPDLCLPLCLALVQPSVLSRATFVSVVSICSLPVPLLLFPTFWSMWLQSGNGNANYLFFQCLGYQGFICILMVEFVSGAIQRDKALQMTRRLMKEKDERQEPVNPEGETGNKQDEAKAMDE